MLRPQPPVPSSIRRLPAPHRAPATLEASPPIPTLEAPVLTLETRALAQEAPAPGRPAVIAPLAPGSYRVQFTASAQTHEKLRLAQELLRHQIPGGDVGQVIDRALTALLKDLKRQKFAETDQPGGRARIGAAKNHDTDANHSTIGRSRHVPAEVRRTVWVRDGGRCAFVARNGRRCTDRGMLEFHHVEPHSAGGESTVDNIQLRCRAHNGFEAELFFGRPDDRGRVSTRSGPSPSGTDGKFTPQNVCGPPRGRVR